MVCLSRMVLLPFRRRFELETVLLPVISFKGYSVDTRDPFSDMIYVTRSVNSCADNWSTNPSGIVDF